MTARLFQFAIRLALGAALALAAAFVLVRQPVGVVLAVLWTAFWVAGQQRGWRWASGLGLLLFVGLLTFGAVVHAKSSLLLAAMGLVLAAWDVQRYAVWLRPVRIRAEHNLVRTHFVRLGAALAVGLGVGGLASTLRTDIGFGWLLLLGLVTVAGMGWLFDALRRNTTT